MADWKSLLNSDPTDWLLEGDNPSVRYLTLTRLLGEAESSRAAREAKRDIMRDGVVPRILSKQRDGGWSEPGRFYRDKYEGSVWQLIVLAEHMADGAHPKVRSACEHLLDHSQDRESHGFSAGESGREDGGRHSEVIPCLTGNMVFSLIRLGCLEDERVRKAVDWITRYQRFDDGVAVAPTGWPYDRFEICFGRHTCHMGAVKALKALAEVPAWLRSKAVEETIKVGCEYFLEHRIHKRSHDLAKVSKPGWLKLQFPLMYQSDILEVALILTQLGSRDERLQEAIDKIVSKQTPDGKWLLEASFNGRFQVDIERRGAPSKWITLRALLALEGYYG